MLIGDYIVLVLGIEGLVVGRDVDLVVGELVAAEVFEEVGVEGAGEVDVGVGGIFGLWVRLVAVLLCSG